MISILGPQRVFILTVLILLVGALAGASYSYFIPRNEALRVEVQTIAGQLGATRQETETIRTEYSNIETQIKLFNNLKDVDFFEPQDRNDARKRFEAIQRFTGALGITYQIAAAEIERNETLDKASQVMLRTPIQIKVDAMDDLDLYGFLYMMLNSFPGHVSLSRMDFGRTADVNEVTLRQIGSGTPMIMMTGQMEFYWRSIIPADQAQGAVDAAAAGM